MTNTVFLPIFTLLLGWILANAAADVRSHRAGRAAFRRAISDLLEVRHRLRGYKRLKVEIVKRMPIPIPPEVQLQFSRMILEMVGVDSALAQRYLRSLDALAELDPVLAYRLRGKDQVEHFLKAAHRVAEVDSAFALLAMRSDAAVLEIAIPSLEEAILEATKGMERRLHRRIKLLFAKTDEPDSVSLRQLDAIEATLREMFAKAGILAIEPVK